MRYLLKTFIFNALSFYVLSLVFQGIKYPSLTVLLYAAVAFSLLNVFVKPILKILTFPINLITFGLFSSLLNVLILYLVTQFVPEFRIVAFTLKSYEVFGFHTPILYLSSFWAYFAVSASLGFLSGIFWSLLG